MTEVLSIHSDGASHFGAPLRRSSSASSTSFLLQNPPAYTRSTSSLKSRYAALGYDTSRLPPSVSSTAPSSPRLNAPGFSNQPSYTSTPSSSLSLEEQCTITQDDDEIVFPSYNGAEYFEEMCDPAPTSSPEQMDSGAPSPCSETPATKPFTDGSDQLPFAGDDTAIADTPTRHVDYLSHNWKEEDIWASWRHIVSRRNDYTNSRRLENASWRTWAKAKHHLKTISPEALNWMKDHDVTWLYGPLQISKARSLATIPTPQAPQFSRTNSFASKKPILKKRSLSELMLQRSLSSSTLMKQATDAVRAQSSDKRPRDRPSFSTRASSELATCFEFETPLTQTDTNISSTDPSTSSSGIQTPCTKRHIHFNNKVEQCIAINEEGDDTLDDSNAVEDDSDSEEDMLIMKPVPIPTKAKISRPNSPRGSFSMENKTIAMLPSTTLNYRGDTPEPRENEIRRPEARSSPESPLFHSSSQQTIRPSNASSTYHVDDDEDDADMNWQPSSTRRGSVFPRNGLESEQEDEEDLPTGHGLRRTPSGMFMPYDDEDEEDYINAGLLGRVVDTVNTAKDIAHVIWNVGWRR